jgi:hypothetical protein
MDFAALAPASKLAVRPARRSAVPHNPAGVLAQLMDFSGGVALAELLSAPIPGGPPHPEAARLASTLHDRVRARLDTAQPLVLAPLTGSRAPKLLTATELFEALARVAGGLGRLPKADAAGRLARELGAPRRSALAASLRQVQAQFAALRVEITDDLHALGPYAQHLEGIDAALQRSIQGKLGELVGRMEEAADRSFARACAQACAALPAEFDASELEGWAAADGWIEQHRARCVQIVNAWFEHSQRSLEGLLRAIEANVR